SSPVQSSVTVPFTRSRNACADDASAASSRPTMTTAPPCPSSIDSMVLPLTAPRRQCRNAEPDRDPDLPRRRRVIVVDAIRHPLHQVQPEPARLAFLDRLVDVHVGRLRHIERLTVAIDEADLDPTLDRAQPDLH